MAFVAFIFSPLIPFSLAFGGAHFAIDPLCSRIDYPLLFHPQGDVSITAIGISRIYFWVVTFTFLWAVGGLAFLYLAAVVVKNTRRAGISGNFVRIYAISMPFVVTSLIFTYLGGADVVEKLSMKERCIFELPIRVLSNIPIFEIQTENSSIATIGIFQKLQYFYVSNIIFSVVVSIFFVASVVSLLLPNRKGGKHKPANLRKRLERLNQAALAGAIALTASMFEAAAFMEIGGGFLQGRDANRYDSLTAGHQALWGSVWTLTLLTIYVPAVFCIRGRIRSLAIPKKSKRTYEARINWLKSVGLHFDFSQQIRSIIAMFGPLLAAPASELLALI